MENTSIKGAPQEIAENAVPIGKPFAHPEITRAVKEIRHADAKEAAQLLSSGDWIAFYAAINGEKFTFALGRVN